MNTRFLVLGAFLLNAAVGTAQLVKIEVRPLSDDDIKLIREDIQAVKDSVITNTMQFTETENTVFWPIYKEYAAEQRALAEKRFGIIMDYAKRIDTMTDQDAGGLTQRMLQAEDDTQSLRKKYFPKFEAALGTKRAAKFYQVDNRLTMIMNVQLASEIPLIP